MMLIDTTATETMKLRGFTENFDWIKKDLEFVKKGYKGIFDLAASFSEKSSQDQCSKQHFF